MYSHLAEVAIIGVLIGVTFFFFLFFSRLYFAWLCRVVFLYHPVENEVILVAHAVEKVFEKFSQVTDVRFFLKFETPTIIQINGELLGESLCQRFNRG